MCSSQGSGETNLRGEKKFSYTEFSVFFFVVVVIFVLFFLAGPHQPNISLLY